MSLVSNNLTSSKPYLIRAIYEWLLDNGLTPLIAVNTQYEGVIVPSKYVIDNRIILNITPTAIHNLRIGNDAIEFQARFDGRIFSIFIPIIAVLAVYAKENNRGMIFPPEEEVNDVDETLKSSDKPTKRKFTLVQGGASDNDIATKSDDK